MAELAVSKCDLAWFCTGRRMLSLFGYSLLCGLGVCKVTTNGGASACNHFTTNTALITLTGRPPTLVRPILHHPIRRHRFDQSSRVRASAKSTRCQPASPSKVDRTDEAALRRRKPTETPPMAATRARAIKARRRRTTVKKQKYTTIVEEVDQF